MLSGVIVISWLMLSASAFPDGAPVDACVKAKPNRPYHGKNEPKDPQTSPYQLLASGSLYRPGVNVTVVITGSDVFRGFFIQARDVATGQWIGQFTQAENLNLIPECSAITHADNQDKVEATLLWTAPDNIPKGRVYFTGSVVKTFSTFWSDLISNELQAY